MLGVAAALRDAHATGLADRLPDPDQPALLLARIVFPDGTAEWRSTSFAAPLDVALAVGAGALMDWGHGVAPSSQRMKDSGKVWRTDYAGAKVASLELVRAGEAEVLFHAERAQSRKAGKAIRRREAFDRKRGARTSRGR